MRQDLFDRTVDANGMKAKDSKHTVRVSLSMNTETNDQKKLWADKAQNLL